MIKASSPLLPWLARARAARPIVILLALAAAPGGPACGESGDAPLPFEAASPAAAPDPAAFGPFPVGVRTVTFVDESRPWKDGEPRRLVTEIWYPAVEDARGQPAASYDIRTLLTETQLAQTAGMETPLLKTAAVRDAAPRSARGPFPLVVFSHGMGAVRWQSTFYTVLLASHGYVVASPDHDRATLYDLLRNEEPQVFDAVWLRPEDVSFVIDSLAELPAGDPLHRLADTRNVGATGHSLGGMTAYRAAAMDQRVKAIVPQAPPDIGLSMTGFADPLQIPVMLQAGSADLVLKRFGTDSIAGWNEHPIPRVLLNLVRGGHYSFSDLCAFDLISLADTIDVELPEGVDLHDFLDDGCGAESTPALAAQRLINHFAVGFFNATLRGSNGSWDYLTQAHADRIVPGEAEIRVDR